MTDLLTYGIIVIALSIAINIAQLQPTFKAFSKLNAKKNTVINKLLYLPRAIMILPLLVKALFLDTVIIAIGGGAGLSGGVTGFILGLALSCMISMAIKASLLVNKWLEKKQSLNTCE